MNATILGIAGIMLLLSSTTSLIFLLKRNFKKCITSPIYLLVTSDILSSISTAVLLFINQYNEITSEENDDGTNDVMKILKKFNGTNERNIDCDLKRIVMNYSLFLIPFVNSFVSLLSMSIQYNFDVEIFSKKCKNIMSTMKNGNSVFTSLADKRNTLTIFNVANQWLLPIIFTLVLQFAERKDVKSNERASDITCALTMNFPFENCYSIIAENDIEYFNFSHNLTDKDNYIEDLSLAKIQRNSSETDEVVSNIYNIVESVMNNSGIKFERPETYYNQTQLLSITNYTSIPEEIVDLDDEVKLFEDLMKNLSSYSTEYLTESLIPTTTEPPSTTSIQNYLKSDGEIHRDIMQKIQSVNTKLTIKNRRRPTVSPRGRLYLSGDEINPEFPDEITRIYECVKNECFLSTDFLKIHLFLLLIFVYFGPILLSALLNMRSKYVCVNALERLDNSGRKSLDNVFGCDSTPSETPKPAKFGWFAAKQNADETAEIDVSEGRAKGDKTVREDGGCLQGMRKEAEEMRKLVETFRSSLVIGIVLWTPMFMEILMKVFLCSDPPMWLVNFFYLLAISFGVVRNYLNLRILKSSEIVWDAFKKTNIVYPSGSSVSDGYSTAFALKYQTITSTKPMKSITKSSGKH